MSSLFFHHKPNLDKLAKILKARSKRWGGNYCGLCFLIDDLPIEEKLGIDSFLEYAKYIESTFTDDVNMEKGFQVDHVKPTSRAITINEYAEFMHYTNTRAEAKNRNEEKSNWFEFEYAYIAMDEKRHFPKSRVAQYYGSIPSSDVYDSCKDNKKVLKDLDYRFHYYYFGMAESFLCYDLLSEELKQKRLDWYKKHHEKFVYDVTKNEEVIKKLVQPPTEEELKWNPEIYKREKPSYNWGSWGVWGESSKLCKFNHVFHEEIIEDPTRYLQMRKKLINKEVLTDSDFNEALSDFGYL
jgi:hypothetical protein